MKSLRVFNYIPELDAFRVDPEFERVICKFGLSEWSPVVFIGRYFARDNDFGEHWFDNWDERDELEERAKAIGIEESEELLIIVPDRKYFQDGEDGPCHPTELRKQFWTNVLKSLTLDMDFLAAEARWNRDRELEWEKRKTAGDPAFKNRPKEEWLDKLEERIAEEMQ